MKNIHYILLITIIFISLISGCDKDNIDSSLTSDINKSRGTTPDKLLPEPGNRGAISIIPLSGGAVKLLWTSGVDETTAPAELTYRIYISFANNITSPDDAEANGTPVTGWMSGAGSATIPGLGKNTAYFFNILMRNKNGSIKAYVPVSIITPGGIYLLPADKFSGDMIPPSSLNPRSDIDAIVRLSRESLYPALVCSNIRAFISMSAGDSIMNFPALYGVPENWQVTGPSGAVIGYSWADLLDGSINLRLNSAGTTPGFWWSGSNEDGSFDPLNSCNGWIDGSNSFDGRNGAHNSIDTDWIKGNTSNCNTQRQLLYLCW